MATGLVSAAFFSPEHAPSSRTDRTAMLPLERGAIIFTWPDYLAKLPKCCQFAADANFNG
jgi:hypothetical protein